MLLNEYFLLTQVKNSDLNLEFERSREYKIYFHHN